MTTGIIGTKIGMTRFFTESGEVVPVTVIKAGPCVVTEVRDEERDGYTATRLGFGEVKARRVAKPQRVEAEKKGVGLFRHQVEIRGMTGHAVGDVVTVDLFSEGDSVNTRSRTIGRGFQGTMKRHNFGGGPASHGSSKFHRAPGSHGNRMTPGEVFKGIKQSGHMGAAMRTTRNLTVVKVDPENHLLYIKGAVSGANGTLVRITKAG